MDSIITNFHVDWHLLLAQAFNFGVVIAVLYFFAFKPLVGIMEERTLKIEKGLSDAEESKRKLEESDLKGKSIVKDARKEADSVLAEADRQAQARQDEAVAKTKKEVAALIEAEKEKIAKEKEKSLSELKEEGMVLAASLAGKILEQKMDDREDEKLINNMLKRS